MGGVAFGGKMMYKVKTLGNHIKYSLKKDIGFYISICSLLVLAGFFLGGILLSNSGLNGLTEAAQIAAAVTSLIIAISAIYSVNIWKNQHFANHQADIARRLAPKLIEMVEFLHFQEKDFQSFVDGTSTHTEYDSLNIVALYHQNLIEVAERMRELTRLSAGISEDVWNEITYLMQTAITEEHDFNNKKCVQTINKLSSIRRANNGTQFNIRLSESFIKKLTARRSHYSQKLTDIYLHLNRVNRFED